MRRLNQTICQALLAALLLALVSTSALAAPRNSGAGRQGQEGNRQGWQQRDGASEERRAPQRQWDQAGDQRGQRLSPEERRQLRRDIRDAGREVYPQR